MVRLTSSISPLTVTLTMPPPAEASTVWDLRFSCAAAKLLLHLASLLHHLLHVHTGHDGSFACGRATSCKGSRGTAGLSNSKIVPRREASKRGGHATSVDIHVLSADRIQ